MRVKEIIEILNANNVKVSGDDIIKLLDNIGIEDADMETDVDKNVCKKLEGKYKVALKPIKAKKAEPKVEVKKEEKDPTKEEKAVSNKEKDTTKVEVKKEEKKVEPKKVEAKPEVKKQEPKKVEKKEEKKQEVELTRVYDDTYNDYVKPEKEYTRIKNVKKNKNKNKNDRQTNIGAKKADNVVYYVPGMTAGQLADSIGMSYSEIVMKLVMLGYMVSATQAIDREVIELLADDAGFILKDQVVEDITKFEEIEIEDDPASLVSRPPIVTIMGHVDHGKTTLLDTIRCSHVTMGEAGGITQHIGAYQVEKHGKLITFIDTPGHAAFTEMRARGAATTDIVILVVAADDGVMPQTREAIDHAKAAKVPIIVAVNKMDKPQANPDRVKQELTQYDLIPEEWGGNTIYVPISALNGTGVEDLLENILLVSEMEDYKANPNRLGIGTVLEAKLDKGRGPVATLLVSNGTIKIGDPIVVGNTYGKIRAMSDETKGNLKSAGPAKAVEVTGLVDVPAAGDHFMIFEDEKTARLVSEERAQRAFNLEKGVGQQISLANIFDNLNNEDKELNLIIKADVQGTLEAVKGSLEKINVEGTKINIIRTGVGAITDTDITLAVASKSILIGFNIRPNSAILKNAEDKGIEVRLYNIIYKLLEDIEAAMKGMLDPVFEEKVIGEAEVRSIFKASKIGTIAGCYITDGLVTRNSEVRLIRDSIVIYTGKISSIKHFKDDVKEVKKGFECGITIENYNDIKEGDIIEAFIMEKVEVK